MTVAVLDDGVDPNHPDIGDFQEFTVGNGSPQGDHGTPVAGVIVARRNGVGGHGVAYDANLVSIATPNLLSTEIAAGIASAAGLDRTYGGIASRPKARSDVVNMSFSFPGEHNVNTVTGAMRDAAGEHLIMVAALGNCGAGGGPECEGDDGIGPSGSPASNVGDPGIAGFAIAVGSLNASGTGRAAHSNTCGTVAQYCLFAPGEGVWTTRNGGEFGKVNGTSFAAPHVSGAAAILRAAFPNKGATQIVQRLLTTARPLDGQDISSVYGHGALDLGAAMRPVGFLSLPAAGRGSPHLLAESFVELPPGFAAPNSAALSAAVVHDEQAFPFLHDLNSAFRPVRRSSAGAMRGFLSTLGGSTSVPLPGGATLEFTHGDSDPLRERATFAAEEMEPGGLEESPRDGAHHYALHVALAPRVALSIGHGSDLPDASSAFLATGRGVLDESLSIGPFSSLVGRGPNLALDWRVGDDTSLHFSGAAGRGWFGDAHTNLTSVGLSRSFGERWTLGGRYGLLRESASFMGARPNGAFGGVSGTQTGFVDLSAAAAVTEGVSLFGSVSRGQAQMQDSTGNDSLLAGWDGVRAGSFALGSEFSNLWRDSDRLTVTLSSPFRADRATIHVNVPTREVADGVLAWERRQVDLSPNGRERRLQMVYEAGEGNVSVAAGAYARFEPDHDPAADPEFGAAVKMRMRF